MKKTASLGVAVLCLAGLINTTYAAKPGYYVGAGVGVSKLDTPNQFLFDNVTGPGVKKSRQIGGVGGRLFAGYNVNQYFGLEAGYARYARSKYNTSVVTTSGNAKANVDYSLYAFDLVGKGYLPIGDSGFNAYVLGGVARATNTTDYSMKFAGKTVVDKSPTTSKFRPVYGVGMSYDVPKSPVTTNLEISRVQGQGNVKTSARAIPNADMVSLNIAYNFD